MLKNIGQVAGQKALNLKVNSQASVLVQQEASLFKKFISKNTAVNFSPCKSKYPRDSIIYCSLSKFDFQDEDIISEALLLLTIAAEKYSEKDRDIDFRRFAIVYIREGLKSIKSKLNNTSSSDENEQIHSAIRYIKKNNHYQDLSHQDKIKLIEHFNLDKEKGYRKVSEFENIQKGTCPIEIQNKESADNNFVLDNEEYKNYDYVANYSLSQNPENIIERKQGNITRDKIINFIKKLNKKEKYIFLKRIYNSHDSYSPLNLVCKKFNISPQAINKCEKKLKNNLKFFYLNSVDNKNSTDISTIWN